MSGNWISWPSSSAATSDGGGGFWSRILPSSSEEFWRDRDNINGGGGGGGGWATIVALILILLWQFSRFFLSLSSRSPTTRSAKPVLLSPSPNPPLRISGIVTDADLKNLIDELDDEFNANEKWVDVIDKKNGLLAYNAKSCKPKDGPLKYLSVTVFENCTTDTLINFYMDNDYRTQWDKTIVEHFQLHVDKTSGTEIGRTIKKFPLLTPREYILAWRLWEGKDKTFYCFIKECEHPLAPLQKKYVRVGYFRSGWRIRKVPGTNACEIKMVHQEDAGLNVEMAKMAFARGIWSYVCKMDNALRKYSAASSPQSSSAMTAITLIQKVPPEWDSITCAAQPAASATSAIGETKAGVKERKLSKRPSKKFIANGLLLLGGVVCLSRGHSTLGAKVAMAYILTKLSKRGTSSGQGSQS